VTSVGVFADLTDQTMPLLDFARAVEEREFASLFLNEHTHLPVEHPTSHFPPGGEVPERYARFWDPYIALSFVAATTALEIGTGVSLIGEHDPLQLAHAVATLDTLSNGRFVFGVGWGWNREEFADHGRPPELRAPVVEEWVLVMRELWTHEVASFDGRFVTFPPSRMWPKPLQRPGPPILLGGPASPRNFDRIARWGDGWITMGETIDRSRLRADLDALRQAWDGAGREGAGPRVTLIHNPLPAAPALADVVGVADDLGVERVLYHVFDGNNTQMLRRLDRAHAAMPA
jgi:probable F420-dependent oxidoreductase